MTTALTLRSVKGAPLTNSEMDANLQALRVTADNALTNGASATLAALNATPIGAITPAAAKVTTLQATSALTLAAPTTVTATTFTVLATDCTLILNPSSGQTLTLGTATAGRVLYLKLTAAFAVTSASANVVPQAGGAAGTAIFAATAGKWATLQGDGSNWQILQSN